MEPRPELLNPYTDVVVMIGIGIYIAERAVALANKIRTAGKRNGGDKQNEILDILHRQTQILEALEKAVGREEEHHQGIRLDQKEILVRLEERRGHRP